MKKLQVRFMRSRDDSIPVGTLAEERHRIYFEYDPGFLVLGLELSPFHLPLRSGLLQHSDHDFGPLPGLFDDSLPDGWGLLLMDRYFRKAGWNLAEISPLDRLSWLGTATMGALTYHPPAERDRLEGSVFDLHGLARHAREVLGGQAVDVLPELLRAGGSPGGARPKVLVGVRGDEMTSGEDDLPDGYDYWIIKFAGRGDFADAGPVEYAYSLMARRGGLDLPSTRLFETAEGDCFFGVRRFDREGTRRLHVHTFGNLVQTNFRIPSSDYADLLKATSLLTRNHQDVLRAFRRMVFNVLAHNRDDHVKNFAFLMDDTPGMWALAPAYDLTYAAGPGGEHSMTVAGEARAPSRDDMLRLAKQGGITQSVAKAILDEVSSAVASWPDHARAAGVTADGRRRIESVVGRL
jgi:serine/threonine-protein kinase HipA